MKVLAIDTSCDETCVAILKIENSKLKILSNVVSSQIKVHKKYGGVVPSLAIREHQKNLIKVLKKGLKEAKLLKEKKSQNISFSIIEKILKKEEKLLKKTKEFLRKYQVPKIDLIAVTQGPGLEPCLWTGINFAKVLSFSWQKPIIPVNHLEGHIFANCLKPIRSKSKVKNKNSKKIKNLLCKPQISNLKSQIFPAIALIVSGGHTELVFVKNIGKYKLLGETKDDAAGECLDKVAKIINLPYPGGPEIEKIAKKGNKNAYNLPRPMSWSKDYDFSFSGLKTAVLYLTKKIGKNKIKNTGIKSDIAASTQQAVIDVLVSKTIKAAKEKKVKTIILGGGVAANKTLKKQFDLKFKNKKMKINLLIPPKNFCTDNATMIAISAYQNRNKSIRPQKDKLNIIKARSNLNFK